MPKPQFEVHEQFRIVPAMNLDALAHSAFIGAKYHFDKIKEIVDSPCMKTLWENDESIDKATKKKLMAEQSQFHWHIRAFFWELVASFDTILQWVNQKYDLGIPEQDVKWKTVHEKAAKANNNQAEWDKKHTLLENAWNSAWYFEVRTYRNFSHRAFIFVNAEYNGYYGKAEPNIKIIWLTPAREGQQDYVDIVKHLVIYLEAMQEFGAEVFTQ